MSASGPRARGPQAELFEACVGESDLDVIVNRTEHLFWALSPPLSDETPENGFSLLKPPLVAPRNLRFSWFYRRLLVPLLSPHLPSLYSFLRNLGPGLRQVT